MASGPGRLRQHFRRENFLHVSQALVEVQIVAVGRSDARRFLAAMLQRVESEIGELGRFGMAKDAENAAVIVEMIVVEDVNFGNHALSSAVAERSAPHAAERIDTPLYHRAALILDAKFAARDCADLRCA